MAGHGNTSCLVVFNVAELARRGDQRIASNGCRRTEIIAWTYRLGLMGGGLCNRACRALYAYSTASSGGASSTPQNGITIPSTIGARIDAQTGTLDVRFMIYGCSRKPSTMAITAYSIST